MARWIYITAACGPRTNGANDLFDHLDYRRYAQVLREQVKPWSYMKFPFINSLGPDKGWYRVGPLARIDNCDFIATPLAEEERKEFMALGEGEPIHVTLAYHWARMIELLHAIEAIKDLLLDPDIFGDELVAKGEMAAGRHRRDRGAARYAVPPLSNERGRADREGQPDRLHHQQQPGDERIDPPGGGTLSGRQGTDRTAAESDRSRGAGLRSLPVLRHPRAGPDAAARGTGRGGVWRGDGLSGAGCRWNRP
jgi:hypothetical protein